EVGARHRGIPQDEAPVPRGPEREPARRDPGDRGESLPGARDSRLRPRRFPAVAEAEILHPGSESQPLAPLHRGIRARRQAIRARARRRHPGDRGPGFGALPRNLASKFFVIRAMSGWLRAERSSGAPQSSRPHDHSIVPAANTFAPDGATEIVDSVGGRSPVSGGTHARATTASRGGDNRTYVLTVV